LKIVSFATYNKIMGYCISKAKARIDHPLEKSPDVVVDKKIKIHPEVFVDNLKTKLSM
jgi:hypothetical protein